MYHTIQEGKKAIRRINKVYPFLEKIFDGHTTMTRKEIMQEYSKIEMETVYYSHSRYYSSTQRNLPCFETLRHLGLLEVVEKEDKTLYFAEDKYGDPELISEKLYNQLPQALQDYCSEKDFLRYHYELVPKVIAIETIINSVNHNLQTLLELVK